MRENKTSDIAVLMLIFRYESGLRMSALLYKKGHLKNQVPHCIIYLEDDRKRVPVALGIINE